MNPADQLEQTIEKLHITTRPETDRRILEDAFVAFEKSGQEQLPHTGHSTRQSTLVIRVVKLAAVAALLVCMSALFFNMLTDRTVELGEVYRAVEKVENICIETFQPLTGEPLQTEWISQTLNIDMFRFEKQFVLWDIPKRVRIMKDLSSNSVKTEMLSNEMLVKIRKTTGRTFGLVPFSDISYVSDALWRRVEKPEVTAVVPGAKVYDLTWPQKDAASGATELKKWRVFVDARTSLPKRTEHYIRLRTKEEYEFKKFEIITYPDEQQIRVLVRDTFGQAASRTDTLEYIGTPAQ